MLRLIVFLLVCYGFTYIVTLGKIFAPVRDLVMRVSKTVGYWIKCPMCFGLWAGLGWALAGLWPSTGMWRPLDLLAAGCVSSGFCWAARVALYKLGADEL